MLQYQMQSLMFLLQDPSSGASEDEEKQHVYAKAASDEIPFETEDEGGEGWEGFDELDLPAQAAKPAESARDSSEAQVTCSVWIASSLVYMLGQTTPATFVGAANLQQFFHERADSTHIKVQSKAHGDVLIKDEPEGLLLSAWLC